MAWLPSTHVVETRQILRRLYQLLPRRLAEIEKKYRIQFSYGKAHRLALCDPQYQRHLDEIVEMRYRLEKLKVEWDVQVKRRQTVQSLRHWKGPS